MTAPQRYADKVTIITGGSKGIGKGCVQIFGRLRFYLHERCIAVHAHSWVKKA